MIVIDDFFSDAEAVLAMARTATFDATHSYAGRGAFLHDCQHQELMEAVSRRVECPISWAVKRASFRLALEGDKAAVMVHHDDTRSSDGVQGRLHWTALVYLSKNPALTTCGLQFLYDPSRGASRVESGNEHQPMPQDGRYQVLGQVQAKFNRGIIFPSASIHTQYGPSGFGSSLEDGRLIFAAWFYT